MAEMQKGQRADLTKGRQGLRDLVVAVGWQAPAGMTIDTAALISTPAASLS